MPEMIDFCCLEQARNADGHDEEGQHCHVQLFVILHVEDAANKSEFQVCAQRVDSTRCYLSSTSAMLASPPDTTSSTPMATHSSFSSLASLATRQERIHLSAHSVKK